MSPRARRAAGALALALSPALVLALWTIGAGAFFAWTLEPAERALLMNWLAPRAAMLLFLGLLLALALGLAVHALWQRRVAAPARLAERAQALVAGAGDGAIEAEGSADNRALAGAFNALVRQRGELHADIDRRVRDASREIERQRSRLAALMAELAQSVLVCNLDGRILLYNRRALEQFRARSDTEAPAGGGELIGLGRSIHDVLDPALIAHALQTIRLRLQRGDPHPSVQFLTATRGGPLLRTHLVPVQDIDDTRPGGGEGGETASAMAPGAALSGYLLMLEDVTEPFAAAALRDRTMQELIQGSRASLGNLQAAVEMIDYPDVDDTMRERLREVIRTEVRTMGARLHEVAARDAQAQKTRWPLEDMPGADLLAIARRRIEASLDCRVDVDAIDTGLWLKVDSFSLLQALAHLAERLVAEYEVRVLRLRLAPAGARAHLDLVWQGLALSTETVTGWETDAMRSASASSALSVRDVIERHDGEIWFQRERARHESFFRLLLPIAETSAVHAGTNAPSPATAAISGVHGALASRPEYYDFDLFRDAGSAAALADRPLAALTCTVFDTETTGLDPGGGDRIVQIGAARIVAGKLRPHECFERLVDPQRPVSAASLAIHGIDAARLAGQARAAQVLPAFHAFARDSVLVGHNAAFDLRFLREAETEAGVVFDQPVLDTLLLSACLHPQQESHSLEAIAARLGVALSGRHSALGDALVTAEIFLKLIPLLEARGIRTLQQALEAAQQTWHARLRY